MSQIFSIDSSPLSSDIDERAYYGRQATDFFWYVETLLMFTFPNPSRFSA